MLGNKYAGCAIAALILGAYAWGQTSPYDRVIVDFAQSVNVNGTVLPPGHYEIRQLRNSAGGVQILFVASDNGSRYEASGATIPIMSNEPPAETKVILQRIGQNYYLNRIWISGKEYGYEFPLPEEAKNLMKERTELTLNAMYRQEQPQVAQAPPAPPPPPQEPPRQPEARPQPEAAPPPPPPEQPAPQPAPEPAPAPALPPTADNWAALVLVGGGLSALGLLLRRK